jgi:hypothetical protein
MKHKHWLILGGAVATAFFVWHPLTRRIIIWLLPLGRGIDDLIALILIVVALWFGGRSWWINWNKTKAFRRIDRDKNLKVKQVALVTLAGIAALFVPGFTDCAMRTLLYGKAPDPTMLVTLGATLIVMMAGWNLLSYLDKRRR